MVIGVDGTPYSFVRRMVDESHLPNFARLLAHGSMSSMRSSYPFVSGVAWTSFMTGKNPGKHGIYGFIERRPDSYETYIPTSRDVKAPTLFETLSQRGKRVCALGVPMSYPPRPVNGVMVGCFLSPDVDRATYPPALASELKAMGYKVDTDPWAARRSVDHFLDDFRRTFAARARVILHLLDAQPWDLFVAHIIDTDRLHHFLWACYEERDPRYYAPFLDCYQQVDTFLGTLTERLGDRDELLIVSDHGSCSVYQEVFLNRWLCDRGYLKLANGSAEGLEGIDRSSLAYSLDPGRVYINLRGREPDGVVDAGDQYKELVAKLGSELLELRDPAGGERVTSHVLRGQDIYWGPFANAGPDLLVMPRPGYDVKGAFDSQSLLKDSALKGMHTFDDALLYVRGRQIVNDDPVIMDVMPTILDLMREPVPEGVDGQICVR